MSIGKIYVDNRIKWNDNVEVSCGPDEFQARTTYNE